MIETRVDTPTEADTPDAGHSCSFIIPARNEESHILACMRSLQSQQTRNTKALNIQLIVVDNTSTDKTAEIAAQCGAKVINVPPGNPGRARNAGVKQSASEYIAFIDADCVLPDNWLLNSIDTLIKPQVVAVGSPQAPAPHDAGWVERVWVNTIIPEESTEWKPVDWLPSFNLLLRRSDFVSAGGFDESLQTCEDSDLSYRLGKRGKLVLNHVTPVRHLGESKTLLEFFRREMWRSRGNLSSALKRGTVREEFTSLFIPFSFALTFSAVLISLLLTLLLQLPIVKFLTPVGLGLILGPLVVSIAKKGVNDCIPRAVLIATYLLARGTGLVVPARRVERRSKAIA